MTIQTQQAKAATKSLIVYFNEIASSTFNFINNTAVLGFGFHLANKPSAHSAAAQQPETLQGMFNHWASWIIVFLVLVNLVKYTHDLFQIMFNGKNNIYLTTLLAIFIALLTSTALFMVIYQIMSTLAITPESLGL